MLAGAHEMISKIGIFCILSLFIIGMGLTMCSTDKNPADNLNLAEIIPDEIGDFSAIAGVETYAGEDIYRYMNGAGENYRMYDYISMQMTRLVSPDDNEITVELFDMGNCRNAFGIYTHSREGEEAGVGEGSFSRTGLLCFWQGKYFACLSSLVETEKSKLAIQRLAEILTTAIPPAGKTPEIISLVPGDNLIEESVRYFQNYAILNYHYFLAGENLLMIDSTTEAFLAQYDPDRSYLLGVRYSSADMAQSARENFFAKYLTERDNEGFMQMSDSTWTALILHDKYLAVVFDAPDRTGAASLLSEIIKNINK